MQRKSRRERERESLAILSKEDAENIAAKYCKQSSFQTMETQRVLVHSAATGELRSTVEACWKLYGMKLWNLCLVLTISITATEECLKCWFETV